MEQKMHGVKIKKNTPIVIVINNHHRLRHHHILGKSPEARNRSIE
jgi:hypothetical protein